MASNPLFYQLLLVALVLICLFLHVGLTDNPPRVSNAPLEPQPRRRRRTKEPKPFIGLIHKPLCEACELEADRRPKAPESPPPMITFTRGRRRSIDTHAHFCPAPDCAYRGWLGRGNIRANGHPGGQAWRQLQCVSSHGYFDETHGTIFHGKRASQELIVRVIACLAEGLGLRGTARVFEIDPNTVLQWLVEATEQLNAFSAYFLNELQITQVQLDELYAVLSAVRDGEVSEAEAIERLSRSPHWVWTAVDPKSKLLLSIRVGPRTLAMAQAVLHQIAPLLAPRCVPLFLSDGYSHYLPRIVKKFKTSFAAGFITQLSTCVEPIFGGLSSLLQSWLSTSAPALAPLFLPGYIGAPQDPLSMDDSRHGPRPRHGDDAEKSRWHGSEERYPIS